jgi:tRNA pseudouridine55 synthase
MATGVLPVAVGVATRALEHLAGASKTYLAEIVFGVDTDSHDLDGRVTRVRDSGAITVAAIEEALATFRGAGTQVPPMHAAIKVGGRKLYELARAGEEIEREARDITIHRLELVAWDAPVATVLVDCSKGFYVRALARDLGERLGCGAHLSDLVRTRTGPVCLADAWTLGELAALAEDGLGAHWPTVAMHPDVMLGDLGVIVIDDVSLGYWRRGIPVKTGEASDEPVAVYTTAGDWVGLAQGDAGESVWRPEKVVAAVSEVQE